MKSSMGNACEISGKVLQALRSQSITDIRIADKVAYLEPINAILQQAGIDYNASFDSRTGDTLNLKNFEKKIPSEVNVWWRMLTDVHAKGTDEYNSLWLHGNTWFYNNSRTTNITRMSALATNIGTDLPLAPLKTRTNNYILTYQEKINTVTGEKTGVKTDSSSFATAVNNSSTAMLMVYAGLIIIFNGDLGKVLAFFPMEFIYKASKMREYRKLIPLASRRKMCSRKWKTGDKIILKNNRMVDLMVGLAESKEAAVLTWYTLAAGETITVTPADIGNTALKALIVKNNNLITQGDITVTILEA
ncbi:MAG: hypothetical protein WCH21_08510 [Bacteroidota bacterium]